MKNKGKAVFYNALEKVYFWIEKIIYEKDDRSEALLEKIEKLQESISEKQDEIDKLEDTVEYYRNTRGGRF